VNATREFLGYVEILRRRRRDRGPAPSPAEERQAHKLWLEAERVQEAWLDSDAAGVLYYAGVPLLPPWESIKLDLWPDRRTAAARKPSKGTAGRHLLRLDRAQADALEDDFTKKQAAIDRGKPEPRFSIRKLAMDHGIGRTRMGEYWQAWTDGKRLPRRS
jgi:hypothetical protein